MVEILKNIEAIRKEKGIIQEVIAERLGISQSGYSNYITRNPDIYFGRLSQIANAIGVPVIDIITYPKKFIDSESIVCDNSKQKPRVVIQLELEEEKKEQVLNIVFGDNNVKILNK